MDAAEGTCENCGAEAEHCRAVRRIYLVPEEVTLKEVEQWCSACRSQYPHLEVGAEGCRPGRSMP